MKYLYALLTLMSVFLISFAEELNMADQTNYPADEAVKSDLDSPQSRRNFWDFLDHESAPSLSEPIPPEPTIPAEPADKCPVEGQPCGQTLKDRAVRGCCEGLFCPQSDASMVLADGTWWSVCQAHSPELNPRGQSPMSLVDVSDSGNASTVTLLPRKWPRPEEIGGLHPFPLSLVKMFAQVMQDIPFVSAPIIYETSQFDGWTMECEHIAEELFTRTAASFLSRAAPCLNWIVYHTYDKHHDGEWIDDTDAVQCLTTPYQLPIPGREYIGDASQGYQICAAREATFRLKGDKGYINWAFEGVFERYDNDNKHPDRGGPVVRFTDRGLDKCAATDGAGYAVQVSPMGQPLYDLVPFDALSAKSMMILNTRNEGNWFSERLWKPTNEYQVPLPHGIENPGPSRKVAIEPKEVQSRPSYHFVDCTANGVESKGIAYFPGGTISNNSIFTNYQDYHNDSPHWGSVGTTQLNSVNLNWNFMGGFSAEVEAQRDSESVLGRMDINQQRAWLRNGTGEVVVDDEDKVCRSRYWAYSTGRQTAVGKSRVAVKSPAGWW